MLKKLNAAMDYIEAHLEEVAAGVGISDLSFRQLFYALTGMTLQEYVKNRRLSEASGALLRGCSVTDTAYRYGYQSVDGFIRAFRRWSGLLPSEAARTRQGRTFQRLNFIVTVQGGDTMEYRIVEKPASLWAVFPCEGAFPAVMQDTMARIYSQWLVTADYELADSLSFSFTRMDAAVPGQAYSEIWVPVREKRC